MNDLTLKTVTVLDNSIFIDEGNCVRCVETDEFKELSLFDMFHFGPSAMKAVITTSEDKFDELVTDIRATLSFAHNVQERAVLLSDILRDAQYNITVSHNGCLSA